MLKYFKIWKRYFILISLCFIAFVLPLKVSAQLLTPVGLVQVSFVEPQNRPFSTNFIFIADLSPSIDLQFFNLFVISPWNTNSVWAVKNIPIAPFDNNQRMHFWFDLGETGLTDGTPVNNLLIGYTITNNHILTPPPSLSFSPINVSPFGYDVGNGFIDEDPDFDLIFPRPGLSFGLLDLPVDLAEHMVYRGCRVPNIELDNSTNPPTEQYAGDKAACGPAGAANSLHWLEDEHSEINSNTTLREKLKELSKMMNRAANSGVGMENFIKGKLDFIDKYKLPIHVKFQGRSVSRTDDIPSPNEKYKHKADNKNANKEDESKWPVDWDFFYSEMKAGEDVELFLDFYTVVDEGNLERTGGHVVTVTGATDLGGNKRIWVKDDANQSSAGGTEQTPLTWMLIPDSDIPYIKEWSEGDELTVISGMVSESYDETVQFLADTKSSTFGRISFIEPFVLSNSNDGLFGTYLFENDELRFMNVLARNDESSNPVWLVRNLPIMPFPEPHWVSVPIELVALNLTSTTPIQVQFFFSPEDLHTPPDWRVDSFFDIFYETPLVHDVPDGGDTPEAPVSAEPDETVPTEFSGSKAVADSLYRGCKVPNVDLDNSTNPSVEDGYSGDLNACGPAAAGNSLQWLSDTHDRINTDNTLREKLVELSKMMNRGKEKGVNTRQLVQGKLAFIEKYKLPIKVKFQSKWLGTADIPSPNTESTTKGENKNGSANAWPTWEWLVQEMKHGEDVEILYGYYDSDGVRQDGHWVTVTGVFNSSNEKRIWIKDDIDQDNAGLGKTNDNRDKGGKEMIPWGTTESGIPILKRFGQSGWQLRVESIVSESYDPDLDKASVTTKVPTDVTSNSAKSGGEVTDGGGSSITQKGVCWNTSGSPTIDDFFSSDGIGEASYESELINLIPSTQYFVRAYVINDAGVSYGQEETFTTLPCDISGAVLHFQPGSIPQIDMSPVYLWTDEALPADNATQNQANREPRFRTNVINGFGAVEFIMNPNPLLSDGLFIPYTPDVTTLITSPNLPDNTPKTLTVVFRCDGINLTSPQVIFEAGGASHGFNIYRYLNRVYFGMWRSPYRYFMSLPIPNAMNTHIAQLEFTGTSFRAVLDGALIGSIPFSGIYYENNRSGIGAQFTGTRFNTGSIGASFSNGFNGMISELVLANEWNNFGLTCDIYNCLRDKYGLTEPYPDCQGGQSEKIAINEDISNENSDFNVIPAYPNPFSETTRLQITVAESQNISIDLFDYMGRKVLSFENRYLEAGTFSEIVIDGNDLPNGIYSCKISGNKFQETFKLVLIK